MGRPVSTLDAVGRLEGLRLDLRNLHGSIMLNSQRSKSASPPAPPKDAVSVGLAMIVRDGGQFLDHLLAEASPHVDEIVVGDTGSQDDSVAVAARHGARTFRIPWQDDFSAARNAVLSRCRCDWIVVVDADERLGPRGWQDLRAWCAARRSDPAPAAACLVTRNYVPHPFDRRGWQPVPIPDPHALPDGAPSAGFVPSAKVRVFPRHPGVCFRGRLHETVEASLRELGLPVVTLAVPVHHFGTMNRDEDKQRRYLRLAQSKAAEQPHDPRAWSELADCAVTAGDLNLALVAVERALVLEPADLENTLTAGWLLKELGRLPDAEKYLVDVATSVKATDDQIAEACHLRGQIALLGRRGDEAGPLLALATRLIPSNGHYHNSIGVWHLTCGRGDAARRALERARDLMPHLADPCLNLGRMYEAANHHDLATRQFQDALSRDPGCEQAVVALSRLEPVR